MTTDMSCPSVSSVQYLCLSWTVVPVSYHLHPTLVAMKTGTILYIFSITCLFPFSDSVKLQVFCSPFSQFLTCRQVYCLFGTKFVVHVPVPLWSFIHACTVVKRIQQLREVCFVAVAKISLTTGGRTYSMSTAESILQQFVTLTDRAIVTPAHVYSMQFYFF